MKQPLALLVGLGLFLLTACGPPNKADHEALAACGTAECTRGSAQLIEGEWGFAMYGMPCIIEGLRDRKPGLYGMLLDHTFTNGGDSTEFTLFVTPSGEVEVAAYRRSSFEYETEETWEPTQRCALAPVSYFDGCLTAVQAGDGQDATAAAWDCVYPGGASGTEQELPWFEGCLAKAPTCE